MSERRQVLLRVDPAVHDAIARWADDEFRSVNAQIEVLLRRALSDAGRLPKTGRTAAQARPAPSHAGLTASDWVEGRAAPRRPRPAGRARRADRAGPGRSLRARARSAPCTPGCTPRRHRRPATARRRAGTRPPPRSRRRSRRCPVNVGNSVPPGSAVTDQVTAA